MKKSFYWVGILIAAIVVVSVILIGQGGKKPPGKLLARVGDEVITVEDFKREWQRNLSASAAFPPEGVDQFLNDMIVEKLFLSEARRRKVEQNPNFQKEIKNYREQLLVEVLLNQEVLSVPRPLPSEIENYFKENREKFSVPELIRISHILIKAKENETDEELQGRLAEVLERIEAGEDFAQLAREVSEGSSASRGGDLGYFPPGRIVPELEARAWELEVGDVSGPIETEYGYHIIKLTDKKSPRDKSLEEAQPEVINALQAGKRKARFDDLETRLKAEAIIRIDQEALGQLRALEEVKP